MTEQPAYAKRAAYVRLLPRLLVLVAGMALGIGLIVYLLRSVDRDKLGTSIANVEYGFLLLGIPFFAANLLLKVPRWGLLFGKDAPSFDTMFGAINVGYAVNTVLPLRLGDFVRAYWIRDKSGIRMVHTLSTIALERVLDGVTLFAVFLVIAPTVSLPTSVRASAIAAGAVFVVVLPAMILLAFYSNRESWLARYLERLEMGRWAIVARVVRQIADGLRALHHWRTVALVVLYTILIWVSNGMLLWLVVKAFHIDAPLSAGGLGTAVVNLGMAVPSTPGYLGVFDYLMVVTLGLYSVKTTQALAVSLIFHAIAFIPVTIIGIIYIGRYGMAKTVDMLRNASR